MLFPSRLAIERTENRSARTFYYSTINIDSLQDYKVSQIWTTLRKCFPRAGLGPQDINDQSNLMTLEAGVHREFGLFRIAFEATICSLNVYSRARSRRGEEHANSCRE